MTATDRTAYPRLDHRVSLTELTSNFTLSESDRAVTAAHARIDANRLTFAILMKTRQAYGLFVRPAGLSDSIVAHMAGQLDLPAPPQFITNRLTLHRYRSVIRTHIGGAVYDEAAEALVVATATQAAETMSDPADLINRAIEALVSTNIDLPAFSTLDRTINRVRVAVHRGMFAAVADRFMPQQATDLEALLVVPPDSVTTPFNWLKHTPGPAKPANIRQWTERMAWLESLPDPNPLLGTITHTKRRQFAAEAAALEVSDLIDISQSDKRHTMLLCLIAEAKMRCHDELIEMFLNRIRRLHTAAKERLAHLREQHQVTEEALLATFGQILYAVQELQSDEELGQQVKQVLNAQGGVDRLIEQHALVSAAHGDNLLPLLRPIYAKSRSLLFDLLETLQIATTTQDKSLIQALDIAIAQRRARKPELTGVPDLSFAAKRWINFMRPKRSGAIDRQAFEICVLTYVAHALETGDLSVVGSEHYADFRAQLLPWSDCAPKLEAFCDAVGIPDNADDFVALLKAELAAAARHADVNFTENSALTIDAGGSAHLKRHKADPLPKTLGPFEHEIRLRMPERHLLDILRNAEHWSRYTRHFGPPSGSDPKITRAVQRYLFTVFGYGCNLGPGQTARHAPHIASSQTLRRLNAQHINAAKLEAAMTDIINIYADFPLPHQWGSGKSAVSDGTHVPLRENNLIGARHIRYGVYGAIAYHHVADTYIALFTTFIPCGVWEAVHIFDGMQKNMSVIQPDTLHADTHGQSETVFGLSRLLGIELMPRMRTWADVTLYRPGKSARYVHIDGLFKDTINWRLIARHWRDLMQVVLSIQAGLVIPSMLLRKLGTHNRKSLLYQAFRELGRVQRSLFLLKYMSSAEIRQNINAQTTKVEAFNDFLDWISFGGPVVKSGDPVEQEKQLKYATLVANTVMLSNVADLTDVLTAMIGDGHAVTAELVGHLSPYIRDHIRRFGRFVLDMEQIPKPLNPAAIPFKTAL